MAHRCLEIARVFYLNLYFDQTGYIATRPKPPDANRLSQCPPKPSPNRL